MALVNSKWRKDAGDNAMNALARVAGFGISAAILTKLTGADFTSKSDVNKTIGNVAGPAVALLGVAGDLFLSNPLLRAVSQGMYTMAIPKSIAVIAPSIGSYIGLSGMDMPAIMNGVTPPATPKPAIMNGAQSPVVIVPKSVVQDAANKVRTEYKPQTVNGLAQAMLINN